MIDIHLLVYVGTLALFIVGALVVGILTLVVFTVVAAIASLPRARRNEYVDVVTDNFPVDIEVEETTVEHYDTPAAGQTAKPGQDIAAENFVLRRPGRPRLIQHT